MLGENLGSLLYADVSVMPLSSMLDHANLFEKLGFHTILQNFAHLTQKTDDVSIMSRVMRKPAQTDQTGWIPRVIVVFTG